MVDPMAYPLTDDQDKFLKEASASVKKNAYFMRKAMDEDNLREALRYSAAMLGELRTSYLQPQKYYELYMQVFDELGNLEVFFGEEHSKGRTHAELYELVQHAGNVLPRLYLLVLIGCLYIKAGEAPPQDILHDLVEMTKGVQHPTRGLFLRAFLCQRARPLLPDAPRDAGAAAAGEPRGGDVADSVDFLLTNFVEMNKLWVRMQHQGGPRDRDRREAERAQLQDLVGRNLTAISQLEALSFEMYSSLVLPRLLEQVVSCKDELAQQYLMQCVIQGFPDAFHLGTLDALLGALPELQAGVKLHSVMASLCDRLAKYAASDPSLVSLLDAAHAFEKFVEAIARVAELHGDIPAGNLVEMYAALMNFTAAVHPGNLGNVNRVLGACYDALADRGLGGDAKAERQLVALLSLPLSRHDPVKLFALDRYPPLMSLLPRRTHRDMAVKVVTAALAQRVAVSDVDQVQMLFRFIAPLVEEVSEGDDLDDEDLEEEQELVARLLHQLRCDDPTTQFAILRAARTHLEHGGARRMRHTLPSLCFCALTAVYRLSATPPAGAAGGGEDSVSVEAALQWLLEVALQLADVPAPMQAMRLLLACAHVASEQAGLEMLAYEFVEQAFTLYEEAIADSRHKVTALQSIVGTLHRCYGFGPDNREALAQSVTSYAAKLLKRSDQCRAALAASHLAWQDEPGAAAADAGGGGGGARYPPVRDAGKVMASLKRALKVVGAAKQQRAATARAAAGKHAGASAAALYVEIANHYLYYLEHGVDGMGASTVQQLLELVASELGSAGGGDGGGIAGGGGGSAGGSDEEAAAFWAATKRHIAAQKALEEAGGEGVRSVGYAALTV